MYDYQFGILRTDKTPQAQAHNDEWLGPKTLGIEVVLETLAGRCGLGNIDPQHRGQGGSSAIERALTEPVTPPPAGTKLVTIRLDKDSLGAMAVLVLRAEDRIKDADMWLIARIGAMDRGGYNRFTMQEIESLGYEPAETTNAMNAIIHLNDSWPTVKDKVMEFIRILTGDMPREEVDRIAKMRAGSLGDYYAEECGNVAGDIGFIEAPGKYHLARDWGNKRYKVAIVYDPLHETPSGGMHARYTVVRQPGYFDRNRFEAAMNGIEAQARKVSIQELVRIGSVWGGPKNIVCSPQGAGNETLLSRQQIIERVNEDLYSGILS